MQTTTDISPQNTKSGGYELPAHDRGVVNVTPDQLRAYAASHPESDYALIDVRERDEYQEAHIPGAKLMPLSELERRMAEVKDLPEPNRIFYCRSGARSGRAAMFLAQTLGLPNVFNLVGGVSNYNGDVLPDFPRLGAFDTSGSVTDLLRQALDMEKGADRFYEALLPAFADSPARSILEVLGKAEEAHGRAVYAALRDVSDETLPPFDELFEALPGDLLEDGRTYDEAVQRARALVDRHGDTALLEIALELEYRSYDLYRQLAHDAGSGEHRQAFLDLAGQEKRHVESVFRAFGKLTRN